jgi:hypothetical protein
MNRPIRIAAFAVSAFSICAFSLGANALTVTYTQDDADYTVSTLPTSSFNPTPASSFLTNTHVTGEIPGVYRSPFENASGATGGTLLSDGGYGIGGSFGPWSKLQYTSIQGGGEAIYDFAPSDELSILWGSPDSYNTITFWSEPNGKGTELYSITGSALEIETFGHDLVDFMFSGEDFDSIVLSTTSNAFEFADLSASYVNLATPLPGSLPLLAGGLGAILLLSRRTNSKSPADTAIA